MLDAFYALTGKPVQTSAPGKTNADHIADVLAGVYNAAPNAGNAAALAGSLHHLAGIAARDMAAYAFDHNMTVAQVRNSCYRALANSLRADIMIHPATDKTRADLQTVLSLFLDGDAQGQVSRQSIRAGMTSDAAATIE